MGLLVYCFPSKFSQRLRSNARQAGYNSARFCRRSAAELGAMICEIPKVWLRPEESLASVEVANPAFLQAIREQNASVIFVTPHVGCFEICARYLSQQKPIVVMYRPPRRQALEPAMKFSRDLPNLISVPAGFKGVREFIKTLRNQGDIGLLPDQVALTPDGVWAPFFGRLAFTITLPAKLALQTGARVVLVAGERLPKGAGWRLHFREGPCFEGLTPELQAEAMNKGIEEMIRLMPEQYLWSYNRYKEPKCAPDPEFLTWPPRSQDGVENSAKIEKEERQKK